MSNSLVFTLASNHSGALASLIGQIPSLNYENVVGKSAAVIWLVSSLSAVSTLSTIRIGFVVSKWYDFHRKLFPFRIFVFHLQSFRLWYYLGLYVITWYCQSIIVLY